MSDFIEGVNFNATSQRIGFQPFEPNEGKAWDGPFVFYPTTCVNQNKNVALLFVAEVLHVRVKKVSFVFDFPIDVEHTHFYFIGGEGEGVDNWFKGEKGFGEGVRSEELRDLRIVHGRHFTKERVSDIFAHMGVRWVFGGHGNQTPHRSRVNITDSRVFDRCVVKRLIIRADGDIVRGIKLVSIPIGT